MNLLLSLMIVAVLPADARPAADPDAVQVFACDFEPGTRLNAEGVPTGWSRRTDAQFPRYVPISLAGDAAVGRTCLRIDLDGGAAELRSPRLPLENGYAYFVEVQVRTEGLQYDAAFASLTLAGPDNRQIEQLRSQTIGHTTPWARVRIGPLPAGKASWAVIGLHLEPQSDDPFSEFDLRGSACFDQLRMVRVPLMELDTPDPLHLYPVGDDVSVSCIMTGATHRPEFSWWLEDVRTAAASAAQSIEARPVKARAESWSWQWQHRFERPGFYRLHVTRTAGGGEIERREVPLAVIDALSAVPGGNFGWSLPALDNAAIAPQRLRLLEESRLGWVKVPLWLAASDTAGQHRALELIESMRRRQIALIGVLDQPPRGKSAAQQPPKPAAELFSTLTEQQAQALTATLARYGLQVAAWQVGGDRDASFALASNPAAAWQRVAQRVQRVAGDVETGAYWPAAPAGGPAARPPWRLACLSREPGEADQELADRLARVRKQGAEVMLEIQADDPGQSAREQVGELVHRMLLAKIGGAQFIGFANPLDPARGMVDREGACQPRMLAWRTAAWAIGAARYAGSLVLPGGSHCEVFLDDSRAVLVVWNGVPIQERLHLGSAAESVDALGWRQKLAEQQGRQTIEADRLPHFVIGADPDVMRWRIASRLEQNRFPSVFGLKRRDALTVTNTFAHPVGGVMALVPPPGWKVRPDRIEFKLAAGQEASLPFELFIPLSGTTGSHLLRFDVDVQTQPRRRFEVYHTLTLDDEHLRLAAQASINASGELEVKLRCENRSSEPVTLRCNLFAPGERRMRWEVSNLASGGEDHVFRLPDGQRFRGQTLWLRAEELGGPRVLSYRFVVDPAEPATGQQPSVPGDRTARAIW